MSNSTSRAFAASCALAALSFVAVAAAAPTANAAVTKVHFQQRIALACSGGDCRARFYDLPANEFLDVDYVGCDASTTGLIWSASYAFEPAPSVAVPLGVVWERDSAVYHKLSFASDAGLRVPLGGRLVVLIEYNGGAPSGYCTAIGERLIVN